MRSPIIWYCTALLLAACGGSAQNPPPSAPSSASPGETARPHSPHPEVVQALERIDAQVQNLEQTLQEIAKLEARIATLEEQIKKTLARPAPRRPLRPDPAKVYAVPIAGAPYKGPENAKVTMVKAFEFACPFCRRVAPTLDQLRKEYGNDLKVVYKHLVVHPKKATLPAQAACAANLQGKFAGLEKLIWERIYEVDGNFSRQNLLRQARKAGLRMGRFKADMDGPCVEIVRTDQAQLARVGARGTPSFFINGRFLSGAQPIERFKKLIDEELRTAEGRIAEGTPVRDYYRQWVLERGLKRLETTPNTP